jgi:hypothetical protein
MFLDKGLRDRLGEDDVTSRLLLQVSPLKPPPGASSCSRFSCLMGWLNWGRKAWPPGMEVP